MSTLFMTYANSEKICFYFDKNCGKGYFIRFHNTNSDLKLTLTIDFSILKMVNNQKNVSDTMYNLFRLYIHISCIPYLSVYAMYVIYFD